MHTINHLAHFISALLSSKEFCAALAGAVIGGCFVLSAQIAANRSQRKRDRAKELAVSNAILQAFAAELRAFKDWFVDGLVRIFQYRENEHAKSAPMNLEAIGQNYFTVYDSNADVLGHISDPELRQKIVNTYSQARSLIDAINYHHELYLESVRLGEYRNALIEWEYKTIRERARKLEKSLPDLFNEIERYLSRASTKGA